MDQPHNAHGKGASIMASMRKRKKRKRLNPGVRTEKARQKTRAVAPAIQPAEKHQHLHDDYAAEIKRHMAKGQYKLALSKAKKAHKRLGTEASKTVLLDAYEARIHEMIECGLTVEAKAFLELVEKQQGFSGSRLDALRGAVLIRDGMLDDLLRSLSDPAASKERKAALENIIKKQVFDISALARCESLSPDHPLKTGALALAEAFSKVTSGPVTDEEIALAGIPRRGPLAPWKMLIRAISYFYRRDDNACENCLQAIDPDSAPARLAPAIRSMIAGKTDPKSGKSPSILVEKVCGNRNMIRSALKKAENTLVKNNPASLFKEIRDAVNICKQADPELLDRLKQHIAIRAWLNGCYDDDIAAAMDGPSLKNAYFWRLHARAAEVKGKPLLACSLWEEFRKHAVYEGWFPSQGKEASVIYLHMAGLLNKLPPGDLTWARKQFERNFKGFGSYYQNQPAHIQDAVRKDSGKGLKTDFIYPERLYKLALQSDPAPGTFQKWLAWLDTTAAGWKKTDAVAHAWRKEVPDDPRPLLHLMESAEKRNAFKKALGYLETAEQLDGLNPDVRKARVRLLAAAAIRHLKQRKTRLAKKDISEIETAPQMLEGDRPALLMALKTVCAIVDRNKARINRLSGLLAMSLENKLSAAVLMRGLLTACGIAETAGIQLRFEKNGLEGNEYAAAVARSCCLGDDVGIRVDIPQECERVLIEFFTTQQCTIDAVLIRTLAQAALGSRQMELAYMATGAGISRGGPDTARSLLLRAQSLPEWIDRRGDCIAAAIEMARQQRDADLIKEAVELRRGGKDSPRQSLLDHVLMNERDSAMDPEQLEQILRQEKDAREYPSVSEIVRSLEDDDFDEDEDDFDCQSCDAKGCTNRKAPYMPDGFDEDDDDDEPFDDMADIPPELMSLFMEMFLKHGGLDGKHPDPEEILRKDPEIMQQMMEIMFDNAEENPFKGTGWAPASRKRSRKSGRKH